MTTIVLIEILVECRRMCSPGAERARCGRLFKSDRFLKPERDGAVKRIGPRSPRFPPQAKLSGEIAAGLGRNRSHPPLESTLFLR
ncbi:hypothetical protein HUU61_06150 [Rhodopseudomonas palustris]|nr:hypothetical protein [Rhodopseudomonas palustris]